jgi:transcriptional regulator with XRE-family HTH domain
MAKSALRLKARELRSKGESVKDIASKLGVSKGTVSLWVRDIILSIEQLERLRRSELRGQERGRLKNALFQKQKRLAIIEELKEKGKSKFKKLSNNDLLIAGLALYWGEGSKKLGRLEICNSDPALIKFALLWLDKCFGISRNDIGCYIGINEIHREREKEVKAYWAKLTGIPESNFQKTSFKVSQVYKSYGDIKHYGTLALRPRKTTNLHYKVMGLIEGLKQHSLSSVK